MAKEVDDVICPSCADKWRNEKKALKKMVPLGKTIRDKKVVLVCPYCDGEQCIEIYNRKRP